MSIMDEGGPVDTYANLYAVASENVAPFLCNESSVSLYRVRYGTTVQPKPFDKTARLLVELRWDNEWLAGVPYNAEGWPDEGAVLQASENRGKCIQRHSMRNTPVRKIAIVTVKVAEGCRLED